MDTATLIGEIEKRQKEIQFFKSALLSLKAMEKHGTLARNTRLAKLVVVHNKVVTESAECVGVNKSNATRIISQICKQNNPLLYASGNFPFESDAPLSFLRAHASGFFGS